MFQLSDFFIGDYPVVENFGANPSVYNARYNLQGYPGIRVKLPSLSLILAAADGVVLETGFEQAGKGKYIILQHTGYQTTYGHLNEILVQKDERVVSGQLIAHSNQSGLTDFPCLYFGIAPTDAAGNKTENNGYGGYIDPMGDQVKWDIKNLKEPVTRADVISDMKLTAKEYGILNAQASNYRILVNFLKQTGLEEFLKGAGRVPINLELTPDDSTGGESISLYLSQIANDYEVMNKTIEELRKDVANTMIVAKKAKEKTVAPAAKQPNVVLRLINAVYGLIFVT